MSEKSICAFNIEALHTRIGIFSFENGGFRPQVNGIFGHRKRRFSNTFSRLEIFESGGLYRHVRGQRIKTEFFEYDEVKAAMQSCMCASNYCIESVNYVLMYTSGRANTPF